jgi:hypothetical protein
MIELVFVVCLITAPGHCEDHRDVLPPDVGLMQCMIGAQPHLAGWAAQHPDYKIVRWSCGAINMRPPRLSGDPSG